ncbi:MAG: T9SS type A sorting domain-containing protein [Paraprevotella sp.]|nr:T9SS type A sorting domain-containing protein [Paraprevotella sp.]
MEQIKMLRPRRSRGTLQSSDQWKEFFFIEEITGIDAPKVDKSGNATFDIYDMSGRMVRKGATTTDGLKAGLYIINGRKVLVE